MLKFIRGKGQHHSADRHRIQRELFAYTKTSQHGFPHKPTTIAYDPKMKLLAIGTQSGSLKIFGCPGVEFYAQHPCNETNGGDISIQMLEWVPGTGRILSLISGNQMTLWEPCGPTLNNLRTLSLNGKLRKVSSLCCSFSKDIVWIGTEGGNVYQLDLFTLTNHEAVIYQDIIIGQIPDTYRLNPGAIECLKQLPNAWNKLLISFNRGLCVLWDLKDNYVVRSFLSSGHGQSIGTYLDPSGSVFTWFHADGSFASWHIDNLKSAAVDEQVPYGPDPCKSIMNLVKGFRKTDEIVIFSGGMPRSTYGERNCVSIHCKIGPKICLDFTSKVIDFVVVFSDPDPSQCEVLIVLLEEEICAFDLSDPELPPIKIPYLSSIHASAITCNNLISEVTPAVYEMIKAAGDIQNTQYSGMKWPVNGGNVMNSDETKDKFEIFITGHEDGSVKLWDCSKIVLNLLFHFKTAHFFGHEDFNAISENVDCSYDSEPPFRKAGQFDPYSDDPRLAIKKVNLCHKTGLVAVAGTAGQIVIGNFNNNVSKDVSFKLTTINLVNDRDGFVWKGHDELKIRPDTFELTGPAKLNIQIIGLLQVIPPAAITCLTLETDYSLLAAGTAHGFVLYDYENENTILSRCTLKPNDVTNASEMLSRRKSFKKTLRESFRRLRKGRSSRFAQSSNPKTYGEPRPIERQIEARPMDDAFSSMIRCLVFGKTYITNVYSTVPTFWVATNSSCVSIFILHIKNFEAKCLITAQLAKEIQLKHRAPIVAILLFDQSGNPLDTQVAANGLHRVLIASEEQFKIFSLPHLKPINKYKLTANEGARVRRLSAAQFFCRLPQELFTGNSNKIIDINTNVNHSSRDEQSILIHNEFGLLCLTNMGDCLVLSIPELKRQLNVAAVRRENINGISSLCFTRFGEAVFMISSSELQRISISKTKIVAPTGIIDVEPEVELSVVSPDKYLCDNTNIHNNQENYDANMRNDFENDKKDVNYLSHTTNGESLNIVNETSSNYLEDLTIDSVKDHLDSTGINFSSTTTEEVISRVLLSNMQIENTLMSRREQDATCIQVAAVTDLSTDGNEKELRTMCVTPESNVSAIYKAMPSVENDGKSISKNEESSF